MIARLTLVFIVVLVSSSALAADAPSPAVNGQPVVGGVTMLGNQAGWKGLYPGKSTRADMIKAMGDPVSSGPDPSGLTRVVYGPDAALKFNSIYVDSKDVIRKIGWARFEPADKANYEALVKALGQPTQISPFSFVRIGQTWKFPDGVGLWGAMDSKSGVVANLIFYDPAEKIDIPAPGAPTR